MKKIIGILFIILLSGCLNDSKEATQNGNFIVELLFEKDGCKMYRFKDGFRYVYWSDCRGKAEYTYSTRTGKSSTTHHVESLTSK